MKAVILAGGKGTRLGDKTKTIPKPMMPIKGKPLLEYQIELIKEYGITEVFLIVNHLFETIKAHFGDGKAYGISIKYYVEEEPLGTVGGIKAIQSQLNDDFLVFYGDVMVNMDLARLIKFHKDKKSEATLVLHPNDHPYDSDLVEMEEDGRISAFHSKPHESGKYYSNMVNAGLYLFSPAVFPFLKENVKADFGKDIFPVLYDKIKMFGYNTPEYLKDMGTPDRLARVEGDWESGKVERFNLKNKRKAIFLDRDGVINKHNDYIFKPEQLTLFSYTVEAVKKINRSDFLAIVVTNQPIIARNMTSIAGLKEIHNKMETELGEQRVKLDAIYYCPHHPDKGFPEENKAYKVDCDCRKPAPGMLLRAEEAFNIDLQSSYIIGDSWRDMGAGKAVGVTTIGVMTGMGNRSGRVNPDYLFANVLEAVSFIMDDPFRDAFVQVKKKFENKRKTEAPFVINIGGNSRTGKSTLAMYLKKSLEEMGAETLIVSLDNWIKPKSSREENDDVYGRFQFNLLEEAISELFTKKKVSIEAPYTPIKYQQTGPITYNFENARIIILEGVVALGIESLRNYSDFSIYINSKKIDHKARIFDFYKWKGKEEEEIEHIYQSRKKDEYDIIEETAQFADIVIDPLIL